MKLLAHRGLWRLPEEKNSAQALRRALADGFGVETDVRDCSGRLVISHDPPCAGALGLDDFLTDYAALGARSTLALNIKADGLLPTLSRSLERFAVGNYFVFDMSLPELVQYRRAGFRYFTRLSDHEPEPLRLDGAAGIWVDGFDRNWLDWVRLGRLLDVDEGIRLALVSPELHHRDHAPFWSALREWVNDLPQEHQGRVMLCTDLPGEARNYFHE